MLNYKNRPISCSSCHRTRCTCPHPRRQSCRFYKSPPRQGWTLQIGLRTHSSRKATKRCLKRQFWHNSIIVTAHTGRKNFDFHLTGRIQMEIKLFLFPHSPPLRVHFPVSLRDLVPDRWNWQERRFRIRGSDLGLCTPPRIRTRPEIIGLAASPWDSIRE